MTQILAEDFTFTSPLDDHLKLDVFNKRCWRPNAGKIKSVDVQELIMNGDAIFVIGNAYNQMGNYSGTATILSSKREGLSRTNAFLAQG